MKHSLLRGYDDYGFNRNIVGQDAYATKHIALRLQTYITLRDAAKMALAKTCAMARWHARGRAATT